MTLIEAVNQLAKFSGHKGIADLVKDLTGYHQLRAQQLLTEGMLLEMLDTLRGRLGSVANDTDNDNVVEENLTLANVAYEVLMALAELSPANQEDPMTKEDVANIPEENLVVVSTGHHFDITALVRWHNQRPHKPERNETAEGKYLYNESTRKPFSAKDAKRIHEQAAKKGLYVVPEPAAGSRPVATAPARASAPAAQSPGRFFQSGTQTPPSTSPQENQGPWDDYETASEHLAKLVLYGQENAAKELLAAQSNTDLQAFLTATHTITLPETWFGGRTVSGTVLQIAIKEDDVQMAEMLSHFFEQLDGGQRLMQTQLNGVVPNGDVDTRRRALEQDAFDFAPVIAAIGGNNRQTIETGLAEFRQNFKDYVLSRPQYNPYHPLKAIECYANNSHGWSDGQRDTFWCKVYGYTQRYLSAVDGQATAQGIYYLVERREALRRSFSFRFAPGVAALFPAEAALAGLGFNWFALSGEGALGFRGVRSWVGGRSRTRARLAKLFQTKAQRLGSLCGDNIASRNRLGAQ